MNTFNVVEITHTADGSFAVVELSNEAAALLDFGRDFAFEPFQPADLTEVAAPAVETVAADPVPAAEVPAEPAPVDSVPDVAVSPANPA